MMRITTGSLKGRKIQMPKGIRPTQDKVRKALFDILGDISGVSFLELFAGSGAVGFEALSRGAAEVELVEEKSDACKGIKDNIGSLRLENCLLWQTDAQNAVKKFAGQARKFDIVFLDPPYYQDLSKKTLQTLSDYDILSDNGFIVAQHFKKDELPDTLGVLSLIRQYSYGDTLLSFYKKNSEKRPAEPEFN